MTALRNACRWLYRLLACVGLIAVLVISTPVVSWWAHIYSGPIEQPKGDILILLSAAGDDESIISYSSYWRARVALLAWQSGSFKKIVISGGGGPGMMDFLAAEGIPREAMVVEWRSKSTRENGLETARLIQGMPGSKVLLTSDFHMFRALGVFRKLHIEVTPMPAPDVIKHAVVWYGRLPGLQTMAEETVKIVYYALRGWI